MPFRKEKVDCFVKWWLQVAELSTCCRKWMLVAGWHNFWLAFLFIHTSCSPNLCPLAIPRVDQVDVEIAHVLWPVHIVVKPQSTHSSARWEHLGMNQPRFVKELPWFGWINVQEISLAGRVVCSRAWREPKGHNLYSRWKGQDKTSRNQRKTFLVDDGFKHYSSAYN